MTSLTILGASVLMLSVSTVTPADTVSAVYRPARVIAGTEIVGDSDPSVWRSVLDLLPTRPSRIVLLDVDTLSAAARLKIRGLQAFVVAGDRTVFVVQQATTVLQASVGDAFDRLVLASVIHHEMAHARGLDERAALQAEQDFWRDLVGAGRVDHGLGLTYVRRLEQERRRLPPEPAGLEVSTEEVVAILAAGSAKVLDARPAEEFARGHIPGAVNVAPKRGVPISYYVSDVAAIGRLLDGDTQAPLVLYCNGPYCGKSRRLADELQAAGYRNVRRYQLGIPFWRAAGHVCQVELEGIAGIVAHDRTAVVIDAREAVDFQRGSLPAARNIPRSLVLDAKDTGEVKRAKDDGRLPMLDHNTRIVVIGADAASARFVAEAIAREAFHNVSFYAGVFATVERAFSGSGIRHRSEEL